MAIQDLVHKTVFERVLNARVVSQLMTTYRLVLPPGIVLQLISKIPAWPPSYDNLRLRAAVCSFLIFFQLKMDWCSLENKCPFCIH